MTIVFDTAKAKVNFDALIGALKSACWGWLN